MGCNCGGGSSQPYNHNQSVPNVANGTNQALLRQIEEQQRQQQAIQQVIQQSANPSKTLIKTYR